MMTLAGKNLRLFQPVGVDFQGFRHGGVDLPCIFSGMWPGVHAGDFLPALLGIGAVIYPLGEPQFFEFIIHTPRPIFPPLIELRRAVPPGGGGILPSVGRGAGRAADPIGIG